MATPTLWRRSLLHVAARWPTTRPLATLAPSAAASAVSAASDAVAEDAAPRKATTSSKGFNLISAQSQASREAAVAAGAWENVRNREKLSRKKSKWWAEMDRASFLSLLAEEMSSHTVSSVLRKFMDEFPILHNDWSDQELVMIVGALIKMNRSAVALEVLRNQIQEPNRDRLNRVAAVSARLGNAQVALGVLEITNHFHMVPDVITFTSAIHACARGGRLDIPMAFNLLNEMISAGVEPNSRTYGAAILAYSRLGHWEKIQEFLSAIPFTDDAHRKEVFTCAILSCSRNRQHSYASRLFELLLEDGVYPGDNVCTAALSSCARTSDLTQLRRIFKLMERHAVPSTYSFNCMILAFGKACNIDEALELFNQMGRNSSVSPDLVTFNSLLLAAVRSRKVNMFPVMLPLMSEAGLKWDAITLNILLEGCALSGDVEMARRYWAQATEGKKNDKTPGDKQCVLLDREHHETLMTVFYAAKDYAAIVDLWQNNRICRRRAKTSKTLNFLLRACKELKDDNTAVAILAEFAERGHPLSSVTHHHMLEVFLSADKYTAAYTYLEKMLEQDGLASTFSFTVLIKYLAKNNRHSDVLALFDLYMETCQTSTKAKNPLLHYPSDVLYVLTMRSALEEQDHETALGIYCDLPAQMSMAVRTELLTLVITSCERDGDWRAAVTMYDEMTGKLDADVNVELYKQIVKIVASAGEFDAALDVGGGQWYRQNRPDKGWGL